MNDLSQLPWYKQFWPWFLIVLPASGVLASLYTVSLAVRTTDSMVTIAEDGMDVVAARHAAAERTASELGLVATLAVDAESGAIHAVLRSEENVPRPQSLDLLLSHPTNASRDRSVTLSAALSDVDGSPSWSGHFVSTPDGRWYVVLRPAGETANEWRLSGVWTGETSLRLEPIS